MVLRARWTLAGEPAEDRAKEDEDEESDEEEEERVVLLLGPQTLILALLGAEDGDERDEVEGEALLPALPVRRDTQHSITSNLIQTNKLLLPLRPYFSCFDF